MAGMEAVVGSSAVIVTYWHPGIMLWVADGFTLLSEAYLRGKMVRHAILFFPSKCLTPWQKLTAFIISQWSWLQAAGVRCVTDPRLCCGFRL